MLNTLYSRPGCQDSFSSPYNLGTCTGDGVFVIARKSDISERMCRAMEETTHTKTGVGCALTCSQDQKEIVRSGPNKESNQTSNKNLDAQTHVLNPFQTSPPWPLRQLLQKQNLAEQPRTLRSGSAQSFSVQRSDRIPGNRNAPCEKNIHHFQRPPSAPFNLTYLNPAKEKKKKQISRKQAARRPKTWPLAMKRSHKRC